MTPPPGFPPDSPASADRLWTRRRWLGTAALGLAAAGCGRFRLGGVVPPKSVINILIWENYLPQAVLDAFLAETDIQVVVHTFSSNDQLPGILAPKDARYDLVMPTAFMGKQLMELGLITGFIKQKNLPNLELIDRKTYNPQWDHDNTYLVPYIWGSTGIGYNARRVEGLPKSWADLFAHKARAEEKARAVTAERIEDAKARAADEGDAEDLARVENNTQPLNDDFKISVLDDAHFTIGSALLYMRLSPNTTNTAEIEGAGALLSKFRSQIDYFESDHVRDLLAGRPVVPKAPGEPPDRDLDKLLASLGGKPIDLAMAWSGDVAKAMAVNRQVRLSLPSEGSIIFKDCFAIPAKTQKQEEAEMFVNYLLRPEVAGAVTNYSCYATTVTTAKPYVDRFIINGPTYFLHPAGKDAFLDDNNEASDRVFDRVWREVKRPAV